MVRFPLYGADLVERTSSGRRLRVKRRESRGADDLCEALWVDVTLTVSLPEGFDDFGQMQIGQGRKIASRWCFYLAQCYAIWGALFQQFGSFSVQSRLRLGARVDPESNRRLIRADTLALAASGELLRLLREANAL